MGLSFVYECSAGHMVRSDSRDLLGDQTTVPCPAVYDLGPCIGVIGEPLAYVSDLEANGIDLDHTYERRGNIIWPTSSNPGEVMYARRPLNEDGK